MQLLGQTAPGRPGLGHGGAGGQSQDSPRIGHDSTLPVPRAPGPRAPGPRAPGLGPAALGPAAPGRVRLPAVTAPPGLTGMHVEEHGARDPAAPLVVLVHGVLDQSTSFAATVGRLADLRVVTYDRRGWGSSLDARPPAPSLAAHADDLLAILAGRPATVVGHSIGANVATGLSSMNAASTPYEQRGQGDR